MSNQFSVAVRNARADVYESTIGTSPIMEILTGAPPANCAAVDSGTVLATLTLPSDWMAAASGGSKAMSGSWTDASADGTGTAAHFRIKDSSGTTCHHQGTVSMAGGGGDMIIVNTSFVATQPFSITTFTLTEGNA